MKLTYDLEGKTAVVTGGSRGIGFALAEGLAKSGSEVVIVNRKAEDGKKAAEKINNFGGSAVSIPADVSQKKSVDEMVERVIDRYGRIDVLVNNSGVNVRKPVLEVTEEDWDMMLDTNLKGIFLCCQAVVPHMIEQGGGKVVNMSSMASTYALLNRAPYCASKGGVSQFTSACALEWAKYGICVNAIGPGIVRTPLTEAYMKSNPEKCEKSLEKVPLGRFSVPEDLVGVTLFLASDASDYMTGQTVFVDGGYTLGCMVW